MNERPEPRRAFRLRSNTDRQVRAEVDEELRYHLDHCTEELVARGWTREEARAEAIRQFGDLEETRAYCAREASRALSEERRTMWWDDLRQDVAYGLRGLLRSPTYTFVVVATLAAGIAASTLVFSLMNPYFFRSMPFPEPQELVQIGGVDPVAGWDGGRFSIPQIEDLETRTRAFEEIGAYYYGNVNVREPSGETTRRTASYFTGDLMGVLGTTPLLGRPLVEADARPGAERVLVMGEDLWERRYGSDPGILGRTVDLDGVAHTVVGIMPRDFVFPFGNVHLWLTMDDDPVSTPRASMGALPVGRLADGWTQERAAGELSEILAELSATYPDADGRYDGVSVKPLREALNFAWDVLRTAFFLLLAAVVMLLVIACVNVASLTLARATSRAREVSVRAALGAGKNRLIRQLLAEGGILALLGGALGIALVFLVGPLLSGMLPPDLYRVGDVTVDGKVLAFSALITLATPLLFGLAPALNLTRQPLASVLRSGRSGAGADRGALRGRRALVTLEVALAIILVTGTGLMARSLQEVLSVDLGFEGERILVATLSPGSEAYPEVGDVGAFWEEARARVLDEARVEGVGMVSRFPLNHETFPVPYQVPGAEELPAEDWPTALTSQAGSDYFDAMGIPVLAGQAFAPGDQGENDPVMISKGMADRLFPDGQAIGRSIFYGSGDDPVAGTVVGVVGDVRYEDLTSPLRPHIYRPLEGTGVRRRFLAIRTPGDPAESAAAVRRALQGVDPSVAVTLRPAEEIVRESTLLWALSSAFLGAFGLIALLLATLGIYGVIAFSVAQRRSEIGLRMALGADGGALQRSVIVDGLRLTGLGLVTGLVLAVVLAGLARNLLYGVSILDPLTVGGVVGLFAGVALAASAVPAWRAARVDPLRVLRDE
jgi:predicted permease